MTLTLIDGFEHATLSTSGGLYSAIVNFGTVPDIVQGPASPVRTGNYALRMRNASRIAYAISGSPTIGVAGCWIRWEAIPAASEGIDVIAFPCNSGATPWIRVRNDGLLVLECYDGISATTSGTAGPALTTGAWHWVQLYVDVSANPFVIKGRIDDTDMADFSPAIAATSITNFQLWNNAYAEVGDLTRYYDDVVVYTGAAGDYPIVPKRIRPRRVVANGTHNLEAATSKYYFKDVGGTETFLTNAETDSYQTIDDDPLNGDVDHIGLKGVGIGFGSSAESHTGTTGSTSQASFDTSLAIGARCRGILVFTFNANSNANDATSVKINPAGANIDVPAVASSLATDTAGEPGSCRAWFVGTGLSGVAGTTITLRVNRNNNANTMYAVVIAILADVDLEVTGVTTQSEDGAIAQVAIDDGSPGQSSMRFAGAYTGASSPASAGANSTLLQSIDFGVFGCSVARETTAGQGARNVGLSAGSDDRAYTLLAVRGVTPQAGTAHYVEYAVDDHTEAELPEAVRVLEAMRQDTAQATAIDVDIWDGSNSATILNDYTINSATNLYLSQLVVSPPSGGAWTQAQLDALKARWGMSGGANPLGIPRLAALLVESLHSDTPPRVPTVSLPRREPLTLPVPRVAV